MILPRIKNFVAGKGRFSIGKEFLYCTDGNAAARNLFEYWCALYGISARETERNRASVVFCRADVKHYTVGITEDKICVRYKNATAARDAAATLVNMAAEDENGAYIPCAEIEDYPDCTYRGMMWDPARKYDSIERIKRLIRQAALAKYNVLHLHLNDDIRFAIRSEAVPALNNGAMKQYSLGEMKEIVTYAADFGIDVLPEIDLPAHATPLLRQMPELHCRKNGEPLGKWTVCVSNEKLYEMLDKLVGELAAVFPYKRMHMGGDELAFFDFPEWHQHYEWDHCDECTALAVRNGFTSVWDFYTFYARKVYAILKKHGKEMVIWNDPLDVSEPVDLPKDIRVQYWRIAAKGRGPHAGCTPLKLLEQGYTVVNSDVPNAYGDLYLKEDNLRVWHPRALAGGDARAETCIEGGELCFWDMHQHYEYSVMPSLLLFSDRLWNRAPLTENVDAALSRQIFGLHFENVFALLGQRLFPLDRQARFDMQKIRADKREAEAVRDRLLWQVRCGFGEPELIRPYIYVLDELIARLDPGGACEKLDG